MASWDANPDWQDPNGINGGNKYEGGDGLVFSDVNKIVGDLKYLQTKVSVNSTSTSVSATAKDNRDDTFTASNISQVNVTLPDTFIHGQAYGINFKAGASAPTFNVTNQTGLPLKYVQYGFASDNYVPSANANVSIVFINNGINVLCYISEI